MPGQEQTLANQPITSCPDSRLRRRNKGKVTSAIISRNAIVCLQNQLRFLVREAIEHHIDTIALQETKRIEQLERDSFSTVLGNMGLD